MYLIIRAAVAGALVLASVLASSALAQSSDPDMSGAAARPELGMEARMLGVAAGTLVQTPAGESIGKVQDIVPDAGSGRPAYVLIATRSGSTAVPYSVVSPLLHDGRIVLDRSRLESAPRISEKQLQEKDESAWKNQADHYWQPRATPTLR